MAYATTADLEWTNIQEPANVQFWLTKGAEEIDSKIGQIYATPIVLSPTDAVQRSGYLLLKRINAWLAMGRATIASAAGGEDVQLNALGKYYVDEALAALQAIVKGDIILTGAIPVSPSIDMQGGPQVSNVDETSFVETFRSTFGDPASTTLARQRSLCVSPYGSPHWPW